MKKLSNMFKELISKNRRLMEKTKAQVFPNRQGAGFVILDEENNKHGGIYPSIGAARKAAVEMDLYLPKESVDTEEESVYIDYLNKNKGHRPDKKVFTGPNAFNKAKAWGKKNIDNFNDDMIIFEKVMKESKYKKGDKVIFLDNNNKKSKGVIKYKLNPRGTVNPNHQWYEIEGDNFTVRVEEKDIIKKQ